MKYTIVLSKKAEKQLDKLSDTIVQPILDKITELGDNPRPAGFKKLKGRKGYRVRVGDYRIIYDIYDRELVIDIIALGHRKDIYE
ncbi:MAG: type II toxin-antitoxin system RelE family toxin [Chitinophagales bacterium]|jgi:mRNA interferase RelE/StbE